MKNSGLMSLAWEEVVGLTLNRYCCGLRYRGRLVFPARDGVREV